MNTKIIMVAGISGVGKTTLIKSAQSSCKFQHISAGSIIQNQKLLAEGETKRDVLRLGDISDNQLLLVEGFWKAKDATQDIVVLDGHTVIDTPDGLVPISSSVFVALEVSLFVFVKGEPEQILAQREADLSRNRPQLDLEDIRRHQVEALKATLGLALKLSVPLEVICSGDTKTFTRLLASGNKMIE
ncbi:MAG: AAA family ATPase [Bdellovibrionales bacterium]|nr:AAA family ATPase [Bdellovibrionales bacterium]